MPGSPPDHVVERSPEGFDLATVRNQLVLAGESASIAYAGNKVQVVNDMTGDPQFRIAWTFENDHSAKPVLVIWFETVSD